MRLWCWPAFSILVQPGLLGCTGGRLPHMDAAVLDYLQRGRYSPITYKGKPLAGHFVFNLRIQAAPQRGEDPGSAKVRR